MSVYRRAVLVVPDPVRVPTLYQRGRRWLENRLARLKHRVGWSLRRRDFRRRMFAFRRVVRFQGAYYRIASVYLRKLCVPSIPNAMPIAPRDLGFNADYVIKEFFLGRPLLGKPPKLWAVIELDDDYFDHPLPIDPKPTWE